jgi:hypothetical protein
MNAVSTRESKVENKAERMLTSRVTEGALWLAIVKIYRKKLTIVSSQNSDETFRSGASWASNFRG